MRLDREGRPKRTDYRHAAGADAEFPRISGLHSPRRAADALWMRLFRLESSRLENVLRQARGDDGVRHVGHVVDPEVDRHAADDVGLLATEPSLLEEGDHVEHGVAAGQVEVPVLVAALVVDGHAHGGDEPLRDGRRRRRRRRPLAPPRPAGRVPPDRAEIPRGGLTMTMTALSLEGLSAEVELA